MEHFPWIRTSLTQDYYFISTSSPENVNSTSGGYCQSHNMKVVFKVMSEETMKKQKQEEVVVEKEVFRINSEVRPMTDHVEMASKGEEEKRRDLARKRRRKERRGRQREAVMRMEEEEVEDVKEMRSEWRREEPLAKPSLTGASASLETLSLSLLLLSLVSLAMLPQN